MEVSISSTLLVLNDDSTHYRLYGLYTMEVILATGFGHKVDVINGQFDDLVNSSQCFLQSVVGSEVSTLMLLCKY